jgi:hypothetical protein
MPIVMGKIADASVFLFAVASRDPDLLDDSLR